MSQPLKVVTLIKMKELIQRGWCQNFSAKNRVGHCCNPTDAEATSWCVYGAVWRAEYELTGKITPQFRKAIINDLSQLIHDSPIIFNDEAGRTKVEVLALLDKAIAAAKNEVRDAY